MRRFRGALAIQEPWEETRARGKGSYVWRQGILRFALPMLVVMFVYTFFLEPLLWREPMALEGGVVLRWLMVSLILWPIVGWLFAEWMWRANEKKEREAV